MRFGAVDTLGFASTDLASRTEGVGPVYTDASTIVVSPAFGSHVRTAAPTTGAVEELFRADLNTAELVLEPGGSFALISPLFTARGLVFPGLRGPTRRSRAQWVELEPATFHFETEVCAATRTPPSEPGIQSQSSTEYAGSRFPVVLKRVSEALNGARMETFEEGVASLLSRDLEALTAEYGNWAVASLEHLLESQNVDPETAGETLRTLGKLAHAQSRKYRLSVLLKALRAESARLRYAAALGLASIDEPEAMASLVAAADREPHDSVRKVLRLVVAQLEETLRCRHL